MAFLVMFHPVCGFPNDSYGKVIHCCLKMMVVIKGFVTVSSKIDIIPQGFIYISHNRKKAISGESLCSCALGPESLQIPKEK